jgi:hypothetical protein
MRFAGILNVLLALLPVAAVASQVPSSNVSVVTMRATIILKRDVSGDYSLSPKYFDELARYAKTRYHVVGPFFGIYPVDPDTVGSARQLHWSVAQQLDGAQLSGGSEDGYPNVDAAVLAMNKLRRPEAPYALEVLPPETTAVVKSTIGRAGRDGLAMFPWMASHGYAQIGPTRMEFLGSAHTIGSIPVRIIVPIVKRKSHLVVGLH